MIEMADAGGGLYRRGFAGDTFNAAWYARRMLPENWTVGYGTCVGTDAASGEMLDFMGAQGIDTGAVRRVADRTVGLYMISLAAGERSFSYWRSQSAARLLADDADWLDTIFSGQTIIHFSAITLAILPQLGRETLCAALKSARASGAMVAFDTNLRPALWESEAAMKDGLLLGASVADVVLPSLDEERALWGPVTSDEAIARYAGQGARIVAVKDGGGPVTLFADGKTQVLPASPVGEVVDSTAAGDSFAGAFLAGLGQGQTPENAALSACTLARKVIGARGALVPDIFE